VAKVKKKPQISIKLVNLKLPYPGLDIQDGGLGEILGCLQMAR
jgi:hypothetical protein